MSARPKDATPERPAFLHLHTPAGDVAEPIIVIGEAPKSWRIRVDRPTEIGGGHLLLVGREIYVPKYAVTFTDGRAEP
jgi:hypothetical protein